MIYVFALALAFILAALLLPATIKISERLNIFSKPKKGEIKGKPCLGGIAIFISFAIGATLACLFKKNYISNISAIFLPSIIVVILGFIDDAKDLRPTVKIAIEIVAVIVLIFFGVSTKITFLPNWVNLILTLIWVLYITNAFNLLDIADGLTSGLTVIISMSLLTISLWNKDVVSSLILVSLIGAHMSFLRYNYPPAKLYMGDTGSLFTGFLLASVSINISYASLEKPVAVIVPVLAMSLPIYDTFFLILMRFKNRKPIFNKSNDHFALRLATMGYSEYKSLWVMYLFSIILAIFSLIVAFGPNILGVVISIITALLFIFLGKKVGMVRIND